jgi:hypothetical protein
MIDGVAAGTARVTATAEGKSATVSVTVIPAIAKTVALSRSKAFIAPGKTVQITAYAMDSQLRVIAGRAVSFSTGNPVVASVTPSGLVTANTVGLASITAASGDARAELTLTVQAPTQVAIPVRSGVPSAFLTPGNYSLALRQADDSVTLAEAAGNSATLGGSMVLADTLQFVATPQDNAAMPSRMTASPGDLSKSLWLVLIPQTVTLSSGTFAGSSVPINLTAATTPCLTQSDQCFNGFYGNFAHGVTRWASFPVPVTVDATLDTARVWDALRAMETSIGRRLFVLGDGSEPNRIVVKAGLPPGITGFGGYTTWSWDWLNRMTSVTVWLASSPSRVLVQHEFLHAMGFWHTCAWPSVMGGYGCPQTSELSIYDVAYVSLASAVFDTESAFGAANGGRIPCPLMSIWAAIPNRTLDARCFDDGFSKTVIRTESAP